MYKKIPCMWFFSSFISCNFTFFLIIALLYVDIIDNLKNEKKIVVIQQIKQILKRSAGTFCLVQLLFLKSDVLLTFKSFRKTIAKVYMLR